MMISKTDLFNRFSKYVISRYPYCSEEIILKLLNSNNLLKEIFPYSIFLDKESIYQIKEVCKDSYKVFIDECVNPDYKGKLPFDVRFDLSINYNTDRSLQKNDIKIIELNASDTGFFWLSSVANTLFNNMFGLMDPNISIDEILKLYSKRKDLSCMSKLNFATPIWLEEAWVDQSFRKIIFQEIGNECCLTPFESTYYDLDKNGKVSLFDGNGNLIRDIHLIYHASVFSRLRFDTTFYGFNEPYKLYQNCIEQRSLVDWNSKLCMNLSDKSLMSKITLQNKCQNLAETFIDLDVIPKDISSIWIKPFNEFGGNGVMFTKKDDIFDLYNNFVFQKDYPLPSVKVNGVNLRLLFTCSLTGDGEPLFIGCRGGSNSLICENNDNWIPISLTS